MERLDAFMARANAAYYATRDPFADFTTAPEISQVFGEVLGLWSAVMWTLLGRPSPVLLVEAGPGRGTLMADALRAIGQAMPDFRSALSVHLIETSPRLRAAQARVIPDAIWHDRLDDLPDAPFLLLANEFLDALPIRQFVRRGKGWVERWVDGGQWREWGTDATPWPDPLPEGTVVEVNEAGAGIATAVADRLARVPGAALFLDYGPEHSAPGDSLQALRGGAPADPLADPGSADLTAHVDFATFATAARARGAAICGPVPQGMFLARLGLFQRANRLAQGRPPAEAAAIMGAVRRLGEPDRMGRLFKALALTRDGVGPVPGFAD